MLVHKLFYYLNILLYKQIYILVLWVLLNDFMSFPHYFNIQNITESPKTQPTSYKVENTT